MDTKFIEELDQIYKRYGFEIKQNHKGLRGYFYNKSIYPGIDLIKISPEADIESIKSEYYTQGYSVRIQKFDTSEAAEKYLFKVFFRAEGIKFSLKRKYKSFIDQQMRNLPTNSLYEYIRAPYELTLYSGEGTLSEMNSFSSDDSSNSLITKILSLINETRGPLFIIIEAAAGFGKTCTAYEILNEFLNLDDDKIPFFTELSRNRQATIFKYILQNEIEEQFANIISSTVAIHEIKSGRIPLIIDGFDELISKDFSYKQPGFQEVETMLATIVELLRDNAKIIITSRKTAIFNGEEFINWIDHQASEYSLARFTIQEPTIENWLSQEKIDIVNKINFPISKVANPVLLSYLKHIDINELADTLQNQNTIVDKYFEFLLEREQTRQDLLMESESQLRVIKRIVRLMTEMAINSESKEFFKDMFLSYAKKSLEETRKRYSSINKPSIDLLSERLTNHAFFDRKGNKSIGIVNDFVFGTLIGQNLITGKYEQHQPKFANYFEQYFAILAVDAFKVQSEENKLKIWELFNKYEFKFDIQFYFHIDILFKKKLTRNYIGNVLDGFIINNIEFINQNQFEEVTFSNCIFSNCIIKISSFIRSCFVNCQFFDCSLDYDNINQIDLHFTELGCITNNNIFDKFYIDPPLKQINNIDYKKLVLELFFKKNTNISKVRSISKIKTELEDHDIKEISRVIQRLKTDGLIKTNGDQGFITKEGQKYYSLKYLNNN